MNQKKNQILSAVVVALGAAAALARMAMQLWLTEENGMLPRGHWGMWVLWLLLAAAAAIAVTVSLPKGSNRYGDNFTPSAAAAIGSFSMAAGVALSLLMGNPTSRTLLMYIWYISGIGSAAGLVWAGLDRLRGNQPNVLCHAALTIFLSLHMVSRYQPWSGNPQVSVWLFSLLGAVGLTLFSHGNARFDADCGNRHSFLATGLLTGFVCLAAAAHTEYVWLYLGGAIWAFTGLCRMEALPETE